MQLIQRYSLVRAITGKHHQQDALFHKNEETALTFAKSMFSVFLKYHHTAFTARISRRNNALRCLFMSGYVTNNLHLP
jgi:hypothetical protein